MWCGYSQCTSKVEPQYERGPFSEVIMIARWRTRVVMLVEHRAVEPAIDGVE